MSHLTVTTILKNKEKILQTVKGSAPLKATRLTKIREGLTSGMEKSLRTWIEDRTQKRLPLSTLSIAAKARSLFEMLKEKVGPHYNIQFSAGSGRFKRFKQRFLLHNVKVRGESASADAKAPEEFVETLDKLIVEGSYLPHQFFNTDKTCLF
ncbi:tigger transposable element-derived protein 1-like [Trichechus inunguis]